MFWVDESGLHELACAIVDQDGGSGIQWRNGINTITEALGDGIYAGEMNTIIIIINQGISSNDYAAGVCANYSVSQNSSIYGDWYLPSKYEMAIMFTNRITITGTANAHGGSAFAEEFYWSSTESSINLSWEQSFKNSAGAQSHNGKFVPNSVRAVRAF